MKKQIYSLICAAAILFIGCQKEESPQIKDETQYPVTFNVSTFTTELTPMANLRKPTSGKGMQASAQGIQATGGSLTESVNYLKYFVYNESNTKIKELEFQKGEAEFGTIKDLLPTGKYKIFVVGTKKSLFYSGTHYDNSYLSMDLHREEGGDEVFISELQVEINEEPLNQNIILERKIAKVEVNILDEIPIDIAHITFRVTNVAENYFFKGNAIKSEGWVSKTAYYNLENEIPSGNEPHVYFFVPNLITYTYAVNIQAYNFAGDLVVDRTIDNVQVEMNRRTILTGMLFNNNSSGGQGFTIDINDIWGEDIKVDF